MSAKSGLLNLESTFKKDYLLFAGIRKLTNGFEARARYLDLAAVAPDAAASLSNFLFLLPIPMSLFKVSGTMYSGTSFRCGCSLTVCNALSWRKDCKSRGLSSK